MLPKFGQHIGPIFKDQAIQEALKMGPICCTETSWRNYYYTLHNSPEEWRFHVFLENRHAPRSFHFWGEAVRSELLQKFSRPVQSHVTCQPCYNCKFNICYTIVKWTKMTTKLVIVWNEKVFILWLHLGYWHICFS